MQGISFKPRKQKAIRESPLDRLWQTRRLDHLKEINQNPDMWFWQKRFSSDKAFFFSGNKGEIIVKPRYRIEETVYVKEAWATENKYDNLKPSKIPSDAYIHFVVDGVGDYPLNITLGRWRSPMFMPSWAARDFIKITDVRPERLHQINNGDIQAEGLTVARYKCNQNFPDAIVWQYHDGGTYCGESGIPVFKHLWDSINKAYPFDGNFWVFRYCFNLIEDKR